MRFEYLVSVTVRSNLLFIHNSFIIIRPSKHNISSMCIIYLFYAVIVLIL